MSKSAIIAGTGVYDMPGLALEPAVIETPYGQAQVMLGQGGASDLVFLARHGVTHHTPPHRINYRANIKALHQLGVRRILATNAVGSINREMPPLSLVLLDDFVDFSSGRPFTFYDGGDSGLAHTELSHPYCTTLRQQLLETAESLNVPLIPKGVYVCTNGPRFETPAEIRMYGMLGADVVGMTGVPEATLARELGLHYSAVAYSINWAAGVEERIEIVEEGREELLAQLRALFMKVLQTPPSTMPCECADSVWMMHPPKGA